jgi:hypothetical protein
MFEELNPVFLQSSEVKLVFYPGGSTVSERPGRYLRRRPLSSRSSATETQTSPGILRRFFFCHFFIALFMK